MLDERVQEEPQEAPVGLREGKTENDVNQGRLQDALRRARLNEAERSDVILELREVEAARLKVLYESLRDVFADIPPGTDLLECALIPGSPPRLWVDVLAFVAMGRDKRTYRFVKETRYGPKVILETSNVEEMAGSVTDYVAHRLLERSRALASDTTEEPVQLVPATPAGETPPAHQPSAEQPRGGGVGWLGILAALLIGAMFGATALFAYGYYLVAG